jgi:ribosomal protein L11 methyltransferase
MFAYLDDDHIPHPLYKVTLVFARDLDGTLAAEISESIEDFAVSVFMKNHEATDGDRWSVEMTSYGEPDLDAIYARLEEFMRDKNLSGIITRADISAEKLPQKDWLRHVHENFPPVTIGTFFVFGSHYEGETPKGLIPLKIDAATAFGSGEHETTKGCILSFEFLAQQRAFKNALDMGCGSGILAIAMTKIWPDIRVTAVDIDPESIVVTERHAQMNAAEKHFSFEAGDGYQSPVVAKNGPYDLIAANILAGPLIAMAPDLDAHLAPGGFCVLSGLLARQEEDVIAAHAARGLSLVKSIAINDWRALVLQKG